jgi:glycosyltransferase 2 family protein
MLGLVVADNDPAAIAASIARMGWRIAIVLVFPITLVTLFDTLGWRYAFAEDRVGLRILVPARLAGEAFNLTTPTAALGGEAVKTWLLRGRVPTDEAVSSVIVAKTTITLGQGLLLLLGVVLAWTSLAADAAILRAMEWLVALEVVALGAFVVVQTRGLAARGGRLLARLGMSRFEGHATLGRIDEGLATFYRKRPLRLTLSLVCHFVAWLLGAVEAWLILWLLGMPVSLVTATVIEAFGMGIRFATFLVPASVGVLEGGYAATFAALGLGSTAGVSFSLVRRIREAVWIAVGLGAFALMRPGRSASGAREEPRPG